MKKNKFLIAASVLVMLVALALSFPAVAQPVAEALKMPATKLIDLAKMIFMIALGIFLIVSGVASMAVPVVGASLIVIGLALIAIYVIPMFKGKSAI